MGLFLLSLAGCGVKTDDNAENTDDYTLNTNEPNASVVAENPCVSPWVVQGIKNLITQRAGELVASSYGYDDLRQELIDGANIEFSYISAPTAREDGGVSCSTQLNITYYGNHNTREGIVGNVATAINAWGYTTSFMGLGLTPYDMGDFGRMSGNSFSTKMDYYISSTYSENGDKQQSYHAKIKASATMLASIVAFDKYIQDNTIRAEKSAERVERLNRPIDNSDNQGFDVSVNRASNPHAKTNRNIQSDNNEIGDEIDTSTAVDVSSYDDNSESLADDVIVIEEPAQ